MNKYFTIMILVIAVIMSGHFALANEAQVIKKESQKLNNEGILLSDLGNAEIESISDTRVVEKSKAEIKTDIEALRESYQRRANFNFYGFK